MILKITGVAMLGLLCGCPPTVRPEPDAEAKRALLAQVVERVVVPTIEGFVVEAEALEMSARAFDLARRAGPAQTERDAARAAFKTAFLRWQRAEMMGFGPAGQPPTISLGKGLGDTIYSWPTINPCRVDTVLAAKSYANVGFFEAALVTATGLAAVEQLLFGEGVTNACAPTDSLNAMGTWAALSADDLGQRRAEYAHLAAAALVKQAKLLRDQWVNDAAGRYSTGGLPGSGFPTAHAALEEVFAALFQADLKLKTQRIAVPSGLVPTACAEPCPELAEARASRLSREAIVANIDGLRAVLRGDFAEAGHGFDALLEARGAGSLAAEMDSALLAARARAEALPAPIDVAVVSHLTDVQQLHADMKVFTDLLKLQFITVLSLQVPAEGAGDAD